jgi:hypothetical protein
MFFSVQGRGRPICLRPQSHEKGDGNCGNKDFQGDGGHKNLRDKMDMNCLRLDDSSDIEIMAPFILPLGLFYTISRWLRPFFHGIQGVTKVVIP